MGNCWSRFESSESILHRGSTPMARSSGDPVRPSSLMKPSLPTPEDPVPTPLMDGIELIGEMFKKIDPELIDLLFSFIENQLHKMNTPSEAGSSSYEGWLTTVRDATKLAASTIDTISTEAEKLSDSYTMKEMKSVILKVLKGVGDLHWVFIGLSVAAFAVEIYNSVDFTMNESTELLLKILALAKDIKQNGEQMQREKLHIAIGTIVEGVIICLGYLERGKFSRFWSATTVAAQIENINQQLRDVRDFVDQSSLLPDFQWRKDVFLSHSGTQKNFVRQLHRDLTREHVSCFFDEDHNSLPLAHKFPPFIFKAAETCKIAVLVLSTEFIRSKWPMLELSTFISARNSGKNANLKLFPIFFKISPKELSHITKDSPGWQKLEQSNDTRGKWQDALKEVRAINGLHFGEDENEVTFRDKVVDAISCLVKRINPGFPLPLLDFEPVGIEKQVGEVKALLDMEGAQSALAVVVCGFGGVGKSTIAASVVQSLDWTSTDFKFCRAAIDENTPHKTSHIIQLQKDIISKLGGARLDFQDPMEGRLQIKAALKNKCLLLFIDNVVDKDYIGDLLPKDLSSGDQKRESDADKQKTKLRILITSRDKYVKAELNITCQVHEVATLSKRASQCLLSETILQGEVVEDKDFDEKNMINEVADACRGVPLLLSVFGKHLRMERDKHSYQESLDVLRKGDLDSYRNEDLGTKLMFVYDKIKDVEVKEAFLDICTYFHGWEWNLVGDIVDFPKLENLRRRMLVSKSGSGEVIVHDILRLMGMKDTRLTRFLNDKELSNALEDNLDVFGNVKGISLVNDNHLRTIQSTTLEATRQSLRVLMLGDWVTLEGPPCQKAFPNLRYLRVGDITAFPFKDPSKLDKLRVFLNRSKPGMNLPHLPQSLKRISHEVPDVKCNKFENLPLQDLRSLESLIVKPQQSVELPAELHLPTSLVDLDLNRCKHLPKDIGHLTALESLILDRSDLVSLPQGFGKLKKLKHLSMDYCSKLDFLSEELGMLSSLEALSMKECQNLRALPQSLGGLVSLQTLELRGSINLQLLPESFGELRIHSLKLHSLVKLHELPNSLGNMPLLKDFSLILCDSLMSLPNSFVQLKNLETLKIIKCTKLRVLPEDFGRLRCLKHMTVEECQLLKELPHGFGALPALKTFTLRRCNSFVDLPRDFRELTSLEELRLQILPIMSRIPDEFGKLKNLRFLDVRSCFQLKAFSDDFENMATLERLLILNCPELVEAMMEKILKLKNCYMTFINCSTKLSERWARMQGESEHPIVIVSGVHLRDEEEKKRAIRVALLHGKCMEVNNTTDQLMERSSLLVGLEEGTSAMVALIMLPVHVQSYQCEILQRFVNMARKTAETNGWGKVQIVCARKVVGTAQRRTATEEEERADEKGIRRILLSLPKGSCAIPSSESKRLKILRECCDWLYLHRDNHDKLSFVMATVRNDVEGRKSFENFKFSSEKEISRNVEPPPSEIRKAENNHYNSIQNFKNVKLSSEKEISGNVEPPPSQIRKTQNKHYNSIQNFIKLIRIKQSQSVAGESKTREFMEALKGNGIHYLLIHNNNNTSKMVVDDLHGKAIGFIICDFKFFECTKLQQIYKHLQQKDSNFIAIWIPTVLPEDCGHGTYTRLIQCMPWATFTHPQLVNVERGDPCFVLLDKYGQIANHDVLPLLLGWGVKSYPFTQHTIHESLSLVESESCLEFLLHGMNIVGRKPMKNKMTFLYATSPRSAWHRITFQLEQLTQIHGNFEVLYVGQFTSILKQQDYEDATQNMRWPSLSFSDMIMFWYRCKYLASQKVYESNKKSNIMLKTLHGLAQNLCARKIWLVLLDNNGPVTCGGGDVLQMICEIANGEGMAMAMRMVEELMSSLSRGECSPMVKIFFRDEIDNLPQHPQHHLSLYSSLVPYYVCDVCLKSNGYDAGRSYKCKECDWDLCGSCWMAYAKQLFCQR